RPDVASRDDDVAVDAVHGDGGRPEIDRGMRRDGDEQPLAPQPVACPERRPPRLAIEAGPELRVEAECSAANVYEQEGGGTVERERWDGAHPLRCHDEQPGGGRPGRGLS